MTLEQAIAAARAWIAADPDEETRRELEGYIADEQRQGLLLEVMSGSLDFGTAGLRAIVGAGSRRMNRAVIRRTTAGVARYLIEAYGGTSMPPVVVAADARGSSASFRRETIGVLAGHGLRVRFFEQPIATPIAAYVARELAASAAIVITASHNPAEYNGYKLYGSDAVQITTPADETVARWIERAPAARDVPFVEDAERGHAGVERVPPGAVEDYYRAVASLRPPGAPARGLAIVYTPMHGVGAVAVERVLSDAGFARVHVVAAQREPDGRFPTVQFPNPEEPGALDLATALAREVKADLVLANDPDVDRLAACLPDGAGGFVTLTGNQIGLLLADFALERAPRTPTPLVLTSIVSSPMLRVLAGAYGARFEQTLTGFKWIWTAALELTARADLKFAFAYEEALGYSAAEFVRDKDGISAALLLAELGALEKSRNGSLRERLARLYRRHGLWVSVQRSVTRHGLEGAAQIRAAMDRVSLAPPKRILDAAVTAVTDFRTGAERRPRWLPSTSLIELTLGRQGRILVRPSGTEPKLKIYVDLTHPVTSETDVWQQERELRGAAGALAAAVESELGFA